MGGTDNGSGSQRLVAVLATTRAGGFDLGLVLDAFLAEHPAGAVLGSGFSVRLQPVRIVGRWPALGPLPTPAPEVDGQVAALTLGNVKLHRIGAFLRASAKAERSALASGAMIHSTALARPPLVATFSIWRDLAGMRDYAEHSGHSAAIGVHAQRSLHHQSAFIRCVPDVLAGSEGWPT